MVNRNLWDIEDQIRSCENISDFGDTFVQLARSVYIQNDARADIKKAKYTTKSNLTEEKSYTPTNNTLIRLSAYQRAVRPIQH